MNDGELDIGGIYGDTFRIKDLENIELVDKLPAIEMRTNGSALGSHLKGHFRLATKEKAVLFVNTKYPPFVKFTYNGKLYYFNQADADQTEKIYKEL